MNEYWRARRAAARISCNGYQKLRGTLRRIAPSWLRNLLSNLTAGVEGAERPLKDFSFPPPQKYDLICFPIIDWDLRFQRPQHLLSQFARQGHRVFYLHTTFHQSGSSPRVRNITENVFRVRLPGPSDPDTLFRKSFDTRQVERCMEAIERLRERARIDTAILMVELPNWAALALAVSGASGWKTVYDCMDEHSGFAGSKQIHLDQERDLIGRSDLVVATSSMLFEKVSSYSRQAMLLPNAADFDHFSRPGPTRPLDGLSRPVIGYYGAIAEWFDVDMIKDAAERRSDWQFVLIGSTRGADIRSLKRLRNVHLLGELSYNLLPAYLHQFDVACIPFRINPLTQATNPVKFYEYLSAGKPVVSVMLPDLVPFEDYFYPVRSVSEFIPQLEAALKEESAELARARIEFARTNTWQERYNTLSNRLALL